MLRIIFYAAIAILLLSFFGVSIQSVVHSPTGEANFGYVWMLVQDGAHFIVTLGIHLISWLHNLI